MILTGTNITEEVKNNRIIIRPFSPSNINPNSYNYRLGEKLFKLIYKNDEKTIQYKKKSIIKLDEDKWYLEKGNVYLGTTLETIGSDYYVTSLIGRSSLGRLGLFVQISANIGHQGSIHKWTLELHPCQNMFVYPKQVLGQVSFWQPHGMTSEYRGLYGFSDEPLLSKLHTSE